MDTERSISGGSALPLTVRCKGTDRRLSAGPLYVIGRDPECDIVIADARVSWHHAALRLEDGRWVLTDNSSTNGTFAGGQPVDRIQINGECEVRLGHPADGPDLFCSISEPKPGTPARLSTPVAASPVGAGDATGPAPPGQIPLPDESAVTRPLPTAMLRIGRAPDNDLVLSDPRVSRYHAELSMTAGGIGIADLGSNNGTFVNGQRVSIAPLSEGDIVAIGLSKFRVNGLDLRNYADPDADVTDEKAPLPAAASPVEGDSNSERDNGRPLEIRYAVRWRRADLPVHLDHEHAHRPVSQSSEDATRPAQQQELATLMKGYWTISLNADSLLRLVH